MTERRQLLDGRDGVPATPSRARTSHAALAVLLVAGLGGCRHRVMVQLPQISQVQIDLETPPEPTTPPTIPEDAEITPPDLPTTPVTLPRHRPAPPKEPPVQVASAEPEPGVAAIGALSSGGEADPQLQQEIRDLISAIQKRLAALPAALANQQRSQVRQVRLFLKQSQQALASGDAAAARTLATKAKVFMDEVEKK